MNEFIYGILVITVGMIVGMVNNREDPMGWLIGAVTGIIAMCVIT